MSLRAKLVAALGLLVAIGLTVFGFATYARYSRTQYDRLDDQLRTVLAPVAHELTDAVGLGHGPHGRNGHGESNPATTTPTSSGLVGSRASDPNPSPTESSTTDTVGTGSGDGGVSVTSFSGLRELYAELRAPDGTLLAQLTNDSGAPDLPTGTLTTGRFFTVGAAEGSGRWRVVTSEVTDAAGYQVALATPTGPVTDSLRELLIIEVVVGLAILTLLVSGSWFILRQGLRPIEDMAGTARSINAGDLSQRVEAGKGEVGQLGLALNSMLEEIEKAFMAREETERRLRQFLSDASHELRTPLTSIQGFAELFRLGQSSEHVDQAVIMRRIEEESARMKTLVEDLLLLARLDETRTVDRSEVDLAVLAADACTDAVATDRGRRVSLDAPVPVLVAGNPDHLRQAIANLVSNALHHTPSGTAIELSAHPVDGRAVLTVRDHGPGLDPDALSHVFERFWQADAARVGSGAGLGLSIVDSIAREHGGRARATNAPDGGAVFSLELPMAAVSADPADGPVTPPTLSPEGTL
jgi:two-component system OmpR family sensor kinase